VLSCPHAVAMTKKAVAASNMSRNDNLIRTEL
jgi:hypothetical protein